MKILLLLVSVQICFTQVLLPPGFHIQEFATVPGARSMALATDGTLFVSTRDQGMVYAVQDGKVQNILSGRNMPNGVAYKDGNLFVAEVHQVLILRDILNNLKKPLVEVFAGGLPKDKHHGWKFIRFGPDGNLYVPVGAPCNICEEPDPYASILKLDMITRQFSVYARGVRNTVGFDWNPKDQSLWFSDNGRDWMGDDAPPEEINRADKAGLHFGYPYCHGKDILDPEFGKDRDCDSYTKPALSLQAHTAGLGLRFYTGSSFPKKYHGGIFLAQHGSWNRSKKVGYQVVFIPVEGDKAQKAEVFASGWLGEKERVSGRPVDVQNLPDGSILVSDDYAGKIYKIFYAHEE